MKDEIHSILSTDIEQKIMTIRRSLGNTANIQKRTSGCSALSTEFECTLEEIKGLTCITYFCDEGKGFDKIDYDKIMEVRNELIYPILEKFHKAYNKAHPEKREHYYSDYGTALNEYYKLHPHCLDRYAKRIKELYHEATVYPPITVVTFNPLYNETIHITCYDSNDI